MKLTHSNYFSLEASLHYCSVSQFKSFIPAFLGCEAAAMATLSGAYERKSIMAFVEGSFVHAWNQSPEALDQFKSDNPEMYSGRGPTAGQLKSNFQHCNKMIEVLENDPLCMQALSGEKEVIMTAELFGIPWKVMLDSYQPEIGIFADLKALKEIDGKWWNKDAQAYENFLQHYGYIIQMAVYAEVERLANKRDKWLIPHMVIVSKQDPPDHEILYFDHEVIEQSLAIVGNHIERVKLVKSGKVEPMRCEKCPFCLATKKITRIKHYSELNLY